MKPYFRFNLPPQEWRKEELLLWNQFTIDSLQEFVASLASLKNKGIPLSDKAHEVLNTSSPQKQLVIIQEAKNVNYFFGLEKEYFCIGTSFDSQCCNMYGEYKEKLRG